VPSDVTTILISKFVPSKGTETPSHLQGVVLEKHVGPSSSEVINVGERWTVYTMRVLEGHLLWLNMWSPRGWSSRPFYLNYPVIGLGMSDMGRSSRGQVHLIDNPGFRGYLLGPEEASYHDEYVSKEFRYRLSYTDDMDLEIPYESDDARQGEYRAQVSRLRLYNFRCRDQMWYSGDVRETYNVFPGIYRKVTQEENETWRFARRIGSGIDVKNLSEDDALMERPGQRMNSDFRMSKGYAVPKALMSPVAQENIEKIHKYIPELEMDDFSNWFLEDREDPR